MLTAEYTTLHDADVRQIAIKLLVIESIADHEAIRNFETAIANRNIREASRRPVEQRANMQAARTARAQRAQQVTQRQPGVHDIFHQQHILVLDAVIEVLENAHDTWIRH